MSQQQKQVRNLQEEHVDLESGQTSPYLTRMEQYYLSHAAGFDGKIMMADWIPMKARRHMVEHVRAMLRQRAGGNRKVKRMAFKVFVSDPAAKSASTKRFHYGKHKNGTVYKQDRRTGRFVKFSKSERAVIRKK